MPAHYGTKNSDKSMQKKKLKVRIVRRKKYRKVIKVYTHTSPEKCQKFVENLQLIDKSMYNNKIQKSETI